MQIVLLAHELERRARRAAALVALGSVAASTVAAQGVPAGGRTPTTPTLVVFFVVDQMRSDYFQRFEPQLTHGLGRLYHGGAFFNNAFQDHANTETAPGHATTLSGREPRSTGIALNSLGVPDTQSPLVGGGGTGASPFRFRGTTLIDWMRVDDPRSRALSVSRKDRGAILPLGRAHQSAFWYATDGRFTTSTYYADSLPDWLKQFNARKLPQHYAGQAWNLLLDPAQYPEPDSVPAEAGGKLFTFPHVAPADSARTASGFTEYPWMDQVTFQAALAGVAGMKLGQGPQIDLLSVSLSTTDAVGHKYGPGSRELHDQIVRLDQYMGEFIDSLYKLRDSTKIIFALTADHGVTPFWELQPAATRPKVGYVDLTPITTRYTDTLVARGLPRAAFRLDEAILWVDRTSFAAAKVNADSVIRAFARDVRAVPGVNRVDTVALLAKKDTVRDVVARRWYQAVSPDLPAELVVTLDPGAVWGKAGGSASHGSPQDTDAWVPLLFYGSPFKPGIYAERARVVDIAPTLAHVIGVTPTERLDGHILTSALKKP